MKAQDLYDLRQKYEFCSGSDLHEFFCDQVGDPSPPGEVDVNDFAVEKFVNDCCDTVESNTNGTIDMCAARPVIEFMGIRQKKAHGVMIFLD
jgi:hypothetical protein